MDARNALFGRRGPAPSPSPRPPNRPVGQQNSPMPVRQAPPNNYANYDNDYSKESSNQYSPQSSAYGGSSGYAAPVRAPATRGSRLVELRLAKVQDKTIQSQYIYGNICAISPNDFPRGEGGDIYLRLSGPQLAHDYVVMARPTPGFPDGCIALSEPQRQWIRVAQTDTIMADVYQPFEEGDNVYLSNMDVNIKFASVSRATNAPFSSDELAAAFHKMYPNQVFAPGQQLVMDFKSTIFVLKITTISVMNLGEKPSAEAVPPNITDQRRRGILLPQTTVNFFKDPQSPINLTGSRMQRSDPIFRPDFKYEDMGIGGLDEEFATIFRRAFASRVFPQEVVNQLGIMHVKGLLLYGPPGTGKTLIARQISKMLNAREPKIINGPEILNRYVGQSEENVRKLFADAEKEYKEKGDASGLHVIVFDELDAVCKQRGSGSGGGTGVGDSVVNQLLSKLDGVDQLVEISLPDEKGRQDILKIHTNTMSKSGKLGDDVDLADLASRTQNYSGAEISGLVKAAASHAFARHTSGGTGVHVSKLESLRVTMEDFEKALAEVRPAFGYSEDELSRAIQHGIIHYSNDVTRIIETCERYVDSLVTAKNIRNFSVLLHGPTGAGKTALAMWVARAKTSSYPFIKVITPGTLLGCRDDLEKKETIRKVWSDAYKSKLSMIIVDNIEGLIDYVPIGPRFSSIVLQALKTVITEAPPKKGHRVLVMATAKSMQTLEALELTSIFNDDLYVPPVRTMQELQNVLLESKVFEDRGSFTETMNMLSSSTSDPDRVNVGVKDILQLAESARDFPDDTKSSFLADRISALMLRRARGY
ncbi:Vesicular-fusion protein sec18 [Pleurostoma richardsiae]|uniref:Vesicular-fusion protein SEC18 n=1 Tax=Pleurostoma richardsiae TaxID=41990 RepID=A0AA38RJN3_9PEZI|nr:Vesicular-fusion protein sec18 [Pleurostoma richardsiae]